MQSFAEVIAAWPEGALGEDLGVSHGLPAVWKHRNSIPPKYWPELVAAAARRGIHGVNARMLAELAAKRRAA